MTQKTLLQILQNATSVLVDGKLHIVVQKNGEAQLEERYGKTYIVLLDAGKPWLVNINKITSVFHEIDGEELIVWNKEAQK